MDVRTLEYRLTIENRNGSIIQAAICKEEFFAIINGVGQCITFIIIDVLGDVYELCLEEAKAAVDVRRKQMVISFINLNEKP